MVLCDLVVSFSWVLDLLFCKKLGYVFVYF